jgi:glutathione S-transferase
MAESGAIVDYLLAKYGQGRLTVSPDAANFADYLFWFHFANGSLVASAMLELVAGMLGASGDAKAFVSARADRAFAMSEARLGEAAYFAGYEFTAADIMMVFSFTTMRAFIPRDLGPYPNIRAYLQRIGERPAYRSAMAKGDPDMAPMLA